MRDLKKLNIELKNLSNNNIYFFDGYKDLCKDDICSIYDVKSDILIYRDDTHLTAEGSKILGNSFKYFYNKNFLK